MHTLPDPLISTGSHRLWILSIFKHALVIGLPQASGSYIGTGPVAHGGNCEDAHGDADDERVEPVPVFLVAHKCVCEFGLVGMNA